MKLASQNVPREIHLIYLSFDLMDDKSHAEVYLLSLSIVLDALTIKFMYEATMFTSFSWVSSIQ